MNLIFFLYLAAFIILNGSIKRSFPVCFDCADQNPEHMNVGQYIASNVPSLKGLRAQSTSPENGTATLKALSSVMLSLQR